MTTPIDSPLDGPIFAQLTIPRWVPAPDQPASNDVASTEMHRGSVDDFATVIHVPDLESFGLCRLVNWSTSPDGPRSYTIALREWNPQVLLHELLHVIINPILGERTFDHRPNPQLHRVINAVEVGLLPHLMMLAADKPNPLPEATEDGA